MITQIFVFAAALMVASIAAAETKYKAAPAGEYCEFYNEALIVNKLTKRALDYAEFYELDGIALKNCSEDEARNLITEKYATFYNLANHADRLDELEALMIRTYIGSGYQYLHFANKAQPNPIFAKKHLEILDRALAKLPNFEGYVYHGNTVDASNIKIGQVVNFRSYTSTSKNKEIARMFGNTLFNIKVKNGKDLSTTFNEGESEVLMQRGFTIRVTSIENKGFETIINAEQI